MLELELELELANNQYSKSRRGMPDCCEKHLSTDGAAL